MLILVTILPHTYLFLTHCPRCVSLESFESTRAASVSVASKGATKVGKSTANGVSKPGNRSVSSVC
jgi:hypothetical protein